MSWTVLRATLHQHRMPIFWFASGLVFYSWMMTWFYPQIGGGQYAELIESMPPEMLAIFGGTEVSFATLGGYFQTEYLGLMWMLIVASALIIFAARSFAGEIADGTMEFVLAQPVSRVRVAVTRVAALVGYAVVLAAASFAPIQLFGPRYDINLSSETFWTLFAFGTLFMLAVGGFAMLLSSIFRGSGKPGGIAAGVLVLLWIADLVANVSEAAEVFDPINIVSYWQPGTIINGEAAPGAAWWLYGIIAVVTLAGSVVVFARRDVA